MPFPDTFLHIGKDAIRLLESTIQHSGEDLQVRAIRLRGCLPFLRAALPLLQKLRRANVVSPNLIRFHRVCRKELRSKVVVSAPGLLEHAQSPTVAKVEVHVLARKLLPNPPDFKVAVTGIRVMQKHYASRPHLWKPSLEVVLHCSVSMQPINVQNFDGVRLEARVRLVKRFAQQSRKSLVMGAVIGLNFLKYFFRIKAGVLIAAPGIYSKTLGRSTAFFHGLAETEVAFAIMRS